MTRIWLPQILVGVVVAFCVPAAVQASGDDLHAVVLAPRSTSLEDAGPHTSARSLNRRSSQDYSKWPAPLADPFAPNPNEHLYQSDQHRQAHALWQDHVYGGRTEFSSLGSTSIGSQTTNSRYGPKSSERRRRQNPFPGLQPIRENVPEPGEYLSNVIQQRRNDGLSPLPSVGKAFGGFHQRYGRPPTPAEALRMQGTLNRQRIPPSPASQNPDLAVASMRNQNAGEQFIHDMQSRLSDVQDHVVDKEKALEQRREAQLAKKLGGSGHRGRKSRKSSSQGGQSSRRGRMTQASGSGASSSYASGSISLAQSSKQRKPFQRLPPEEVEKLNEMDRAAYVFKDGQERHYEKKERDAGHAQQRMKGQGSNYGSTKSLQGPSMTNNYPDFLHSQKTTKGVVDFGFQNSQKGSSKDGSMASAEVSQGSSKASKSKHSKKARSKKGVSPFEYDWKPPKDDGHSKAG